MVPNRIACAYQAIAVPVVLATTTQPIDVYWINGHTRVLFAAAAVTAAMVGLAFPLKIPVAKAVAITGILYWLLRSATFLLIVLRDTPGRPPWTGVVVYLGLALYIGLYWHRAIVRLGFLQRLAAHDGPGASVPA